ncbi:unnamed protein product [Ascophyllum nodosum]
MCVEVFVSPSCPRNCVGGGMRCPTGIFEGLQMAKPNQESRLINEIWRSSG